MLQRRSPPSGRPRCCPSFLSQEQTGRQRSLPGSPRFPRGAARRRRCRRCCLDSDALHGLAGFQCSPTGAAPQPGFPGASLGAGITQAPAPLLLGAGLWCFGVFMIYFMLDLIPTLSHPVRRATRRGRPAPGAPPHSGRGRTPLFGFKRSSGRGRARPADPGSRLRSRITARLPARLPAPPWWCRRGG